MLMYMKVNLMEENDEIKSIVSHWHSCHTKTFKVPQLVTESSLCKFANYFCSMSQTHAHLTSFWFNQAINFIIQNNNISD